MRRLKLIVADCDGYYVQNFVRYILVNYAHCFDLFSFTTPGYLTEHLCSSDEKADIMLIGKEYLIEPVLKCKTSVIVFLSDEQTIPGDINIKYIYKYQHAEKLVAEIISIYSGNEGRSIIPDGQAASYVVAIFSAAGGSGKTCIAACSSAICAKRGAKVLYINLEAVCSTPAFFKCGTGQSFSNIIYYLKENSGNLVSKIEGARCFDADTGVYFFKPPDNIQDIEELLAVDTELLIHTLKRAALYDVIFVDMTVGLSERNAAVLKLCDRIMHIKVSRADAAVKEGVYETECGVLQEKLGVDVTGKSFSVVNMHKGERTGNSGNVIGFYPTLDQCLCSAYTDCSGFVDDVGKLLDTIFMGR